MKNLLLLLSLGLVLAGCSNKERMRKDEARSREVEASILELRAKVATLQETVRTLRQEAEAIKTENEDLRERGDRTEKSLEIVRSQALSVFAYAQDVARKLERHQKLYEASVASLSAADRHHDSRFRLVDSELSQLKPGLGVLSLKELTRKVEEIEQVLWSR